MAPPPFPKRALLIVNRSAGIGHAAGIASRLMTAARAELSDACDVWLDVVAEHPEAASAVTTFLRQGEGPAVVIVGGGGGTLSAVIDGICRLFDGKELPGPEVVLIGALRMGSGNVLAKQFGVPGGPMEGLRSILAGIKQGTVAPCCVGQYEFTGEDGEAVVDYAATLAGFGQLGRIPGDLARWHKRHPLIHLITAKALTIERLTPAEYGVALVIRIMMTCIRPRRAEVIEVRSGGQIHSLRLLVGAAMNFPMPSLPLNPQVSVNEEKLSLHFLRYHGIFNALSLIARPSLANRSALRLFVEPGKPIEIRLTDRGSAEFFLDEDPVTFHSSLTISTRGRLFFVVPVAKS